MLLCVCMGANCLFNTVCICLVMYISSWVCYLHVFDQCYLLLTLLAGAAAAVGGCCGGHLRCVLRRPAGIAGPTGLTEHSITRAVPLLALPAVCCQVGLLHQRGESEPVTHAVCDA
jgi:hypothetical protein